MDQSTYEVRLASWTEIISQCQARPDGMTAKQWLADNNISEKSYYYWLRRVRLNALGKQPEPLLVPAAPVSDNEPMPVQLAEIPGNSNLVEFSENRLNLHDFAFPLHW